MKDLCPYKWVVKRLSYSPAPEFRPRREYPATLWNISVTNRTVLHPYGHWHWRCRTKRIDELSSGQGSRSNLLCQITSVARHIQHKDLDFKKVFECLLQNLGHLYPVSLCSLLTSKKFVPDYKYFTPPCRYQYGAPCGLPFCIKPGNPPFAPPGSPLSGRRCQWWR